MQRIVTGGGGMIKDNNSGAIRRSKAVELREKNSVVVIVNECVRGDER